MDCNIVFFWEALIIIGVLISIIIAIFVLCCMIMESKSIIKIAIICPDGPPKDVTYNLGIASLFCV